MKAEKWQQLDRQMHQLNMVRPYERLLFNHKKATNTDTWENLDHMRKKPDIKTRYMWSESIYMKSQSSEHVERRKGLELPRSYKCINGVCMVFCFQSDEKCLCRQSRCSHNSPNYCCTKVLWGVAGYLNKAGAKIQDGGWGVAV